MFLEHEFYFDLFLKAIETEFMTFMQNKNNMINLL